MMEKEKNSTIVDIRKRERTKIYLLHKKLYINIMYILYMRNVLHNIISNMMLLKTNLASTCGCEC